MDLVSVIIPVFNVEGYLEKCAYSVMNQSYRNIEIILVDDGSTDNSGKICDLLSHKDNRIKVIHKINGGLSSARNVGLDNCTGKYVYFLDSDDYIEKELIEICVRKLINEGADLVYFGYKSIKNNKDVLLCNYDFDEYYLTNDECKCRFFLEKLLQYKVGWEAWSRLFKKSVIDDYNLRFVDNNKIFAEDMYFNLSYCAHSKKIVGIKEYLYNYIHRSDSIMGKSRAKNKIKEFNELSKELKAHYYKYTDCKCLIDIFPIIHFLIIYHSINAFCSGSSLSYKDVFKVIEQTNLDKTYFVQNLKPLNKYKKELLKYFTKLKTSEYLNFANYFVSGNYASLVLKNRLTYLFYKDKNKSN